MNKLVCITGLPGSGKSEVADYFVAQGYQFVRFGQITLDIIIKKGLIQNEKNEKQIREGLRKRYGMAAFAKLNLPKFKKLIKKGSVVADGLRSFEEYKLLKKTFGKRFISIAVYASPQLRHQRVSQRKPDKHDKAMRQHTFTLAEAWRVDTAQLINLNMGPTIVLADYTILNTKDKKFLLSQVKEVLQQIENR